MAEPIEVQTLTLSLPDHPGNRSLAARQRSSRNAIKHGIFSEVTLLAGESREKYKPCSPKVASNACSSKS